MMRSCVVVATSDNVRLHPMLWPLAGWRHCPLWKTRVRSSMLWHSEQRVDDCKVPENAAHPVTAGSLPGGQARTDVGTAQPRLGCRASPSPFADHFETSAVAGRNQCLR